MIWRQECLQYNEAGNAQGGKLMHRFLIVIEKTESNYSVYSRDLPRLLPRARRVKKQKKYV
jgi:hypothetical protein